MTEDKDGGIATTMINVAADRIGEMLVEMAEGHAEYSYEDIARQALIAGLNTLVEEGPGEDRIAAVGQAVHRRLHDEGDGEWPALPDMEKAFWFDIARHAIAAGDVCIIKELQSD